MIFHEIYGSYYHALAAILKVAKDRPITIPEIYQIIHAHCFGESGTTIPDKLKSGEWPFLKGNTSVLTHVPRFPTTTLERRWLATILADPRVQLFLTEEMPAMPDTPLWKEGDVIYYDRHDRGDPFTEKSYIQNFHAMLRAHREKKEILIRYKTVKGRPKTITGQVEKVEYSQKDDKFRFLVRSKMNEKKGHTLNAGNIVSASMENRPAEHSISAMAPEKKKVTVEITDERNALNRTMLHFSDLGKTTEVAGEKTYQMVLRYDPADEAEILIRLLSFGPFVKVIEPAEMVEKVKARLKRQRALVVGSR